MYWLFILFWTCSGHAYTIPYSENIPLLANEIGTRVQSTRYCKTISLFRELGCRDAFAWIHYPSDSAETVDLALNVSDTVIGPYYQPIVSNWTEWCATNTTKPSFYESGIVSYDYWVGDTTADGNCNGWTSNGEDSCSALTWVQHPLIPELVPSSCRSRHALVCICVDGTQLTTLQPTTMSPSQVPSVTPSAAPTVSPTTSRPSLAPTTSRPSHSPSKSPSNSPSTSPTTSRPTISPTNVPTRTPTLAPTPAPTPPPTFPRSIVGLQIVRGAQGTGLAGGITTIRQSCNTLKSGPGGVYAYGLTWPFLGYPGMGAGSETAYRHDVLYKSGMNPSQAIYNFKREKIANALSDLWVTGTTGYLSYDPAVSNSDRFWSGLDSGGHLDANHCNGWTSNSGNGRLGYGWWPSTPYQFIAEVFGCTSTRYYLCLVEIVKVGGTTYWVQ